MQITDVNIRGVSLPSAEKELWMLHGIRLEEMQDGTVMRRPLLWLISRWSRVEFPFFHSF